jgi:hypothetical protein
MSGEYDTCAHEEPKVKKKRKVMTMSDSAEMFCK